MNANKLNQKQNFDISWIQKDVRCWVYQANQPQQDIYLRGIIKGIIPLNINKANSKVSGILENGSPFESRANLIQKIRDSNSLQRDLIEMDIINAPEVLRQLKRRLYQRKIYTLIWNSLIILNPFKVISEQTGQKVLSMYFDHIFVKKEDIRSHEPHVYSFMMSILSGMNETNKTQVISISGESGSGKTQANKQCLKTIAFCCSKLFQILKLSSGSVETKILKLDPILQVFGNAKTIKNDNSSRFGKLITLRIDGASLKIHHSSVKNYFLQKSRVIVQNPNQRNFHIFYQLLAYLPEDQRLALRLKSNGHPMRYDDFKYLTNRNSSMMNEDRKMWDDLNQAFVTLEFPRELVWQIWSVIAAILLLGNLSFQTINDNEPCDVRNPQVAQSIAFLLGLQRKDLVSALTTQKRVIAGQEIFSALNEKSCMQGRDSVAKAIYESLFTWMVGELNTRINIYSNQASQPKILKLLDIYGFQIFDHNSFEQLCVNFTNQKIHQIYLQQIFKHQKETLKKQGLESVIQKLSFTDNIKIIDLIENLNRSVFNLLDESCSVNVKDDDFLASIKKHHDQHEHFPPRNLVNTRKSFIIKHTPGEIQYQAEGFRDKNKDFIRDDLLNRLCNIKIKLIGNSFRQRVQMLKQEGNKRFLGIKIRKQVKQLITEMSTNTDVHFIRCIKPNEKKEAFTFVDRICYNQIRYLGVLDTIQMRKEAYHIRTPYQSFYKRYGILQNKLNTLIPVSEGKKNPAECKDIVINFVTDQLVKYDLQYQFGKERIFLKMSTQNRIDALLNKKLLMIQYASTRIKTQYRYFRLRKIRQIMKKSLPKIQRNIKNFLIKAKLRKNKVAVVRIENAWINYHEVFFARKKLPYIKKMQKYIKKKIEQKKNQQKSNAILRAKWILKNLAQASTLQQKVKNYGQIKELVHLDLYEQFWNQLEAHYLYNLNKYFKGATCMLSNTKFLKKAEEATNYRLNLRYRRSLQKYVKGYGSRVKYEVKMKAILKIQTFFRMLKRRRQYLSLRGHTVKIQRNWKKYYYDKQFNMQYTQNYFQDGNGGQIKQENSYWRSLLHRNLNKNNQKGMEKLLAENQRVKMDKIGLFYYMLDYQIMTDLSHIYPNNSWIDNYWSLYQQSWHKGNPIQVVDVSDTETIACTLNKVYVWGDVHFQNFQQESTNYKNWIKINPLQTPSGKINKIHAHNRFSVAEIEGFQPFIAGDQKLYLQDCSSKQWKTLNQSYIIINGTVLTIKKAQFCRLSINQKVVQISCGMTHCIAKTSLRKVYVWGDNSKGQLGLGHYKRVLKPKILEYFSKQAITIHQVAASAFGSLILQSNNRILWWGSNGTISNVNFPKQMYLFQKSAYLDNPQKYTVIRILSSWSKSLSIVGVTIAAHQSIFKSSQNAIKKKTYQNLINKWNDDILSVMPPYVQTVSGYFQQKFMPKVKVQAQIRANRELEHQRIREKLLNEIILMQEAQRALLKERKK